MLREAAAALTDGRILVMEASADRVLVAPQQIVIGRDGTLRVAQAGDEGFVVGPDESEHELSFRSCDETWQRDFWAVRSSSCWRRPRMARSSSATRFFSWPLLVVVPDAAGVEDVRAEEFGQAVAEAVVLLSPAAAPVWI
jgi:hypothetical protein